MKSFGRPTAPLLVQLLTLTGLTLVAAWLISSLLLFFLPPPAPDFYRISEIEQTFHGSAPVFTERQPLVLTEQDRPPAPVLEGKSIPAIRDKIAENLGVPSSQVVIAGERGPLSDRRVGRIIRDRVARAGMSEEEHFLISPFNVGVRQADGR